LGGLFGIHAHPVEVVDALGEYGSDVVDQFQHLAFGGGGKIPCHIDLADGLTEGLVDEHHAAFPAGALRGLAGEGFGMEPEVGINEGLG